MKKRNEKNKNAGNGEGSLYYSQTLQKWIYYYHEPNGTRKALRQKKKESSSSFKKRVTELKFKLNTGIYISKSPDTVVNILEYYYNQKLKNNLISERTFAIYKNIVLIIKNNLVDTPIQKITITDIELFTDKIRHYSNETIDKIWNALKLAFKIAYSRRMIQFNLMLDETLIKPNSIKPRKRIGALTLLEQTKLISALKKELKNSPKHEYLIYACLLQLYTGMRIGEVLGLCIDAIDLNNNTITVKRTLTADKKGRIYLSEHTKNFKITENDDRGRRTFTMSFSVKNIIKKLLSQKITNINGILFWNNQKNTYFFSTTINTYLQKINKKYNITSGTLHSHILRHTFITRCVESGMNIKVIQYLVGHINTSSLTLNTYTSVSQDFIKNEFQKLPLFTKKRCI